MKSLKIYTDKDINKDLIKSKKTQTALRFVSLIGINAAYLTELKHYLRSFLLHSNTFHY